MKNTSLVTGGAGFMGAHVVNELLREGDHNVVVLDDLSGGFRDNVNPNAIFVEGSILDVELINKLCEKYNFTYIYHLAAYAAEGLSHFIKRFNYQNNLIGSVNLINAAVNYNVKRFVFTSSIAVYGENQLPMHEELTPMPEDPYGIAKYAVEQELIVTKRLFDLDYTIFRPHNVYGELQNISDRYRNVIGIFMNKIMQGESLVIFGDGEQTRAFTHIADVAPHIAQSVNISEASCEIFNLGTEKHVSVNKLADMVMTAMEREVSVEHFRARDEVKHAYCSHDKFQRVFGTTSKIGLAEGLHRMGTWAKTVGPRPATEFDEIEISQNLPDAWKK
ncbi:MAG: NAD-dependent epimerase/dehydratase family protein [Candidatus Poribacteria bacterium]|nr:NAD-dependent epimerase/dehydratase family protein [Candidatus Poribacteria bacterium]